MGDVDILVNNAGATWGVPTTETVLQAWDTVVNLNVRGYLMLSQLVAQKSMLERRWGRIFYVASFAALGDSPGVMRTIACRTSRDAIVNCTQTLAAEWEQYNITVNAICAGFPPARMTPNTRGDDMLPAQVPSPRGRHEAGEGLKGVCVLFASDAGQHITGQCLAVGDGVSAMSACINNHRKDKTEP
jgi:gluconate 5-dehydrogenase